MHSSLHGYSLLLRTVILKVIMPAPLRETDLFPPLAAYLKKEGYTVHAEVRGADIAARRGNELVIVEMKLRFNLDLLLQAAEKQGAADETYVAVPVKGAGRRKWPPRWSAIKELFDRLGIGIFFIRSINGKPARVEKILAAKDPRLRPGKLADKHILREKLKREMDGRPANFNTGGSAGKKIVTAFLVESLRLAVLLSGRETEPRGLLAHGKRIRAGKKTPAEKAKTLSLKELRGLGAPEKCAAILYRNWHGWFCRKGRGLYTLTPKGETALREYAEVIQSLQDE